jgi:hypothetical protein
MLDTTTSVITPAAAPASGGFKFKPLLIAGIVAVLIIMATGIWVYRLRKRNAALYKAVRALSNDNDQMSAEFEKLRDELTAQQQTHEFERALPEAEYKDRFIPFPFRPQFEPNEEYVIAYDEEFAHWVVRPLFELDKNYDSTMYVYYSNISGEWTFSYRKSEHATKKITLSIKTPHHIMSRILSKDVTDAIRLFRSPEDVSEKDETQITPEPDSDND